MGVSPLEPCIAIELAVNLHMVMNDPIEWTWPEDRRVAISRSYDDGRPDNLDHAVPDLEERGLPGTFYLTTDRGRMQGLLGYLADNSYWVAPVRDIARCVLDRRDRQTK